jgi:hypothetical protein
MAQYTISNTASTYGTVSITAPSTLYTTGVGVGGYSGLWPNSNPVLTANQSTLQVSGDAEFSGRVTIDGQDLAKTLESIQNRLAILVPDPKLLDKYEALKQAYEHYKLLEALCIDANDSKG